MIGTTLAHYRITAAIGAGGMGEVYRATDTKLGRDIAIKVLPDGVAQDPERLARFEREAKLLASLNHPNIAHVYGFETAALDGGAAAHFLAMELVPGEDLAERLKRGPLPVEDALQIARQIAEALEEAHQQGIVHRDLKPANVKVTPDGKVKVLDFGLAKAYAGDPGSGSSTSDLSQSPTLAHTGTQAGLILGTAAYMSPEQARGRPVDRRADIWAFGVLLHEMLTGRPLFSGETVSDVLAAVLTREPDWASLPAATPASIRRLLRRCLERDPRRRLQAAGDARLEIEEALAGGQEPAATLGTGRASRLPWLLVGLLGLAFAVTLARGLLAPTQAPVVTRLKLELTPTESLGRLYGANAVLSPDGRTIAFTSVSEGRSRLNVRRLDELDPRPLAGTEDARIPFFSPDGRWIGFSVQGALLKVGTTGGAPVRISEPLREQCRGATWAGDRIVYAGVTTGLLQVAASGGEPAPLTELDASRDERSHRWPSFLPGGQAVLFMVQHTGQDYADADIEVASLADGHRTVLVHGGAFPHYVAGGYLLFVRNNVLYALRFDPQRLSVDQPPTPVLEGLLGWTGDETGGDGSAELALSDAGDLLYRASSAAGSDTETEVVWLDPSGRETPAFHESINVRGFEISPDGRRVAIEGRSARGLGIFIKDLERGTLTPLSSEGAGESNPVWSPDGRRLAYKARGSPNTRLVVQALDGSEPARELVVPVGTLAAPTSWLPDGSALVVGIYQPETLNDILLLPLDAAKPRLLADAPGVDVDGRVSPDGRWLAFTSSRQGPRQVFVTPLPGPGPVWQASIDGGFGARWSPDGRHLYFAGGDGTSPTAPLLDLPVSEHGQELRFGTPRVLGRDVRGGDPGRAGILAGLQMRRLSVHPDGRLLLVKGQPQAEAIDTSHAILVTGWAAQLARQLR